MQKIDLIISNGQVYQQGREMQQLEIAVNNGVIEEIGTKQQLQQKYCPSKTINAAGKFVFPGFVNTHSHLFQVMTKGMGKEKSLWDWLTSTIRKMAAHMDEEMIYYAALAGCMENLRSGCTTILDFQYCHSFPGQHESVVRAFEDAGIRGYVARPQFSSDYDGIGKQKPENEDMYVQNLEKLAKGKNPEKVGVAIIAPGMPGLFEAPFYRHGYLRHLKEVAQKLQIPYTMHLVETDDDDLYIKEKTGLTSVQFLEKESFFSQSCIAAHCVKMHEEDFAIFKEYDVQVSHNPVSNMILGSGVCPVSRFIKEGVNVSCATDGAGSNDTQDMLEVLKMTTLLQKVTLQDAAALTAGQALDIASIAGARALGRSDIGALAKGKKADLFIFNPNTLKAAPVCNGVSSLVYTSSQENIETVLVDGCSIIEERKFVNLDEEKIISKLITLAQKLRTSANI